MIILKVSFKIKSGRKSNVTVVTIIRIICAVFLDDFQVYRFFETSSNKQNKQDCMNFLI